VFENLLVYGRYFGQADAVTRGRIPELLEFAGLTNRANAKNPGPLRWDEAALVAGAGADQQPGPDIPKMSRQPDSTPRPAT